MSPKQVLTNVTTSQISQNPHKKKNAIKKPPNEALKPSSRTI